MTDVVSDETAETPDAAPLVLPPVPEGQACGWPVTYIDCSGECAAYANWDDPALAQAWFEAMAADLLWNWTGGVFGVCETVIRPCRQDCDGLGDWGSTFWGRGPGFDPGFPRMGGAGGGKPFYPVLVSGRWYNVSCGCLGGCKCDPSGPKVITLPGPAQSVTEVTIDGVTLAPSAYRLDRQRYLIRIDGEVWPNCQDMMAPDDAPGSFVVTYMRGVPVPVGGQVAAGRLACELALAACGDEDCGLPERIQTITRQGLTVGVNTSDTAWEQTGIWSIDNWVSSVNQPRPFAGVRSVDVPSLR